jgi:hypothetical protein
MYRLGGLLCYKEVYNTAIMDLCTMRAGNFFLALIVVFMESRSGRG